MNKNLFLGLFGFIFLCSACSTSVKMTNSTSKSVDIASTGVYHTPVVADLNVSDQKVEAEVFSNRYGTLLSDLKQKAIVQALKEVNADVLVEPKYEVITEGDNKTVIVTGYPATYKNFRNATFKDMDLLLVENENSIETQEIKDQSDDVSSGKALLWLFLGLGAVAGLTLLF